MDIQIRGIELEPRFQALRTKMLATGEHEFKTLIAGMFQQVIREVEVLLDEEAQVEYEAEEEQPAPETPFDVVKVGTDAIYEYLEDVSDPEVLDLLYQAEEANTNYIGGRSTILDAIHLRKKSLRDSAEGEDEVATE